ncbi:MAG: Hsp20/alpha crystallin family protein [Gemmataceae bacterium]
MNLIPWRRSGGGLMEPFQQFQREMDQLMQRFFGDTESSSNSLAVWAPRVDVEEDDKQFVIKADLPGVDVKDVEVSIVDNVLVLRGHKKEEREEKNKNYHRLERFEGQFHREIALPRGIDAEHIQAKSHQGVLTVTIPKKPEVQPKKITVQAEK